MLPTLYKENVVGHRLIIESKYYVVADGFQSPKFCVQYYLFIPEAQLSTFVTFIIIGLPMSCLEMNPTMMPRI